MSTPQRTPWGCGSRVQTGRRRQEATGLIGKHPKLRVEGKLTPMWLAFYLTAEAKTKTFSPRNESHHLDMDNLLDHTIDQIGKYVTETAWERASGDKSAFMHKMIRSCLVINLAVLNPIRHDKRFFPNPSNTVDKKASRMENGKPSCST